MSRSIVILDLDADYALSLADADNDRKRAIIRVLFQNLASSEHEQLLGGFCTGIREVYANEPVTVGDITLEGTNGYSGSLEVSFLGSIHMGCRDIDGGCEHSEQVRFELDFDHNSLSFSTQPPPSLEDREDEF